MAFEILAACVFATHIVAVALLVLWFSSGCPSSMPVFWAQVKKQLGTLLPFRTVKVEVPSSHRPNH